MRMVSVLSAILISSVTAARADDIEVAPGTRVRVTTSGTRLKGILQATDSQSLTVVVEGQRAPIQMERSAIDRLEMGSRRSVGAGAARGAGRGLLIGGGAGLVIGALASPGDGSRGLNAGLSAVVTGMFSALIGAGIGAAEPGESWKAVPARGVHISLAPRRGGLAVSLSF